MRDLFRQLTGLGLSNDQIDGVLAIIESRETAHKQAEDARKAQVRERVQRWRAKQTDDVTLPKRVGNVTKRLTRVEDSSSKIEISGEKKDSAPVARGVEGFRAELSGILDTERVDAVVESRRGRKAPLTPHAGRLLSKALSSCPDISAAADEMILRGWTSVKPEWLERRQPRAASPPEPAKPRNAGEFARMRLREMGELPDAADNQARYFDQGDASANPSGAGIARRFAIASGR